MLSSAARPYFWPISPNNWALRMLSIPRSASRSASSSTISRGYPVCSTTKSTRNVSNSVCTATPPPPAEAGCVAAWPFVAWPFFTWPFVLWPFDAGAGSGARVPAVPPTRGTMYSSRCRSVGNESRDMLSSAARPYFWPISPNNWALRMLSIPRSASRSASSSTISRGYPVCSTTKSTRNVSNSVCIATPPALIREGRRGSHAALPPARANTSHRLASVVAATIAACSAFGDSNRWATESRNRRAPLDASPADESGSSTCDSASSSATASSR